MENSLIEMDVRKSQAKTQEKLASLLDSALLPAHSLVECNKN
jgi:hypothetical protein